MSSKKVKNQCFFSIKVKDVMNNTFEEQWKTRHNLVKLLFLEQSVKSVQIFECMNVLIKSPFEQ